MDDALDGGRVHGGKPAQAILRELAHFIEPGQGEKLRRSQIVLTQHVDENRRRALMGPPQQMGNLIVQGEILALLLVDDKKLTLRVQFFYF